MKLQELAVANPTKQAAKVFESYFGNRVKLDTISGKQAQTLLKRVRGLVREHRRTPEFHHSEQNPSYLKLIMLEQALTARVNEAGIDAGGIQPTADVAGTVNPQQQQAAMAAQQQQKKRQIQDAIKLKQKEIQDLQKQMNNPVMSTMESRRQLRRKLKESEVQQAQVVLAAQDMVDKMQSMLEDASEMQFKELPALVDSIKNQVGIDQAAQFNTDATAALTGLVQNLQGAKQQLDQALGVVTGATPPPDAGMAAMGGAPMPGADMAAAGMDDLDAAANMAGDEIAPPLEEPAPVPPAALGRAKR
jgi:hypothetical protein